MDSYEWNKVFGAVLGTLLIAWGGLLTLNEVLFHEDPLEEPAYRRDLLVAPEPTSSDVEVVAIDIPALMAEASAAAGERVFARCAACHNVVRDGAHAVGPNLWDIVGADIAAKDGYGYSGALSAKDGVWDYEALFAYLENPRGWAPGTAMNFAGLRRERDRANIVEYLRQQADSPYPLPDVTAAPEPAVDDAPAEGEPAEGEPAEGEPAGGETLPADSETVEG